MATNTDDLMPEPRGFSTPPRVRVQQSVVTLTEPVEVANNDRTPVFDQLLLERVRTPPPAPRQLRRRSLVFPISPVPIDNVLVTPIRRQMRTPPSARHSTRRGESRATQRRRSITKQLFA